jgi:hypothetical protein
VVITAKGVNQLKATPVVGEGKKVPLNPRKRLRGDVLRTYACPCFKENVLRERKPTCQGVSAVDMSQVRIHLNRAPHRLGVMQCKVCKEYVISNAKHESCTNVKPQPRGEMADTQWTSLYSKLFPQSSFIPSPCEYCWSLYHFRMLTSDR